MEKRRRPKIRFFIILALIVAAVVVTTVLIIQSRQLVSVEWASTEFTAKYDALVVRDEVVYQAKNYGKTSFIAEEGEYVQIGDPIVEVYEWGYNESTYSGLLDLQKTILEYEANVIREGIIDEQLNDINARIDEKALEISLSVRSRACTDLLPLERNMRTLLEERSTYLRNVMPDNQLTDYLKQEQALLELIAGWRQSITANEAGRVSFYFDGNEALMNKENLGKFTKSMLEEVTAGKTIEVSSDDQGITPLYRVVNENEWYIVMHSDEEIPELYVGNVFSLIFEDYLDSQQTGIVYEKTILENNDGFVYTILIRDPIGPLLGGRRVTAKLYNVQEGMRVPAYCVKTTDEVKYVVTADGQKVPVYIIAQDGDYVFINTYADQASLEIGQQLRK
jgi:hypothetical protein